MSLYHVENMIFQLVVILNEWKNLSKILGKLPTDLIVSKLKQRRNGAARPLKTAGLSRAAPQACLTPASALGPAGNP
jgi:hypothetical protein